MRDYFLQNMIILSTLTCWTFSFAAIVPNVLNIEVNTLQAKKKHLAYQVTPLLQ